MDARGGESNSQHVLFGGDVVRGGDAVQVTHVAERERKFYDGLSSNLVKHIASVSITSSPEPRKANRSDTRYMMIKKTTSD